MRDLLVIVPSRGRPERLARMLDACLSLSEADTRVAVATDSDEPQRAAYGTLKRAGCDSRRPVLWCSGERKTMAAWTNRIAAAWQDGYRALASLGDDHLPRTQGWDRLLLEAIDGMGGTGIAYGDDLIMGERLPTAPVISSDIVRELGWMCAPGLRHMCVDLAWKDLGLQAGCLAYVPEVIIEHVHWCAGKVPQDQVYAEAEARHQDDRDAYARWQENRMAADVITVSALRRA